MTHAPFSSAEPRKQIPFRRNAGADDSFGIAVAVSGDTAVIGATGEDSASNGVNSTPDEASVNAGAAYVFQRTGTTWQQQAYLKDNNDNRVRSFGVALAVTGDLVVVGVPNEDSSTTGINTTPNVGAAGSGAAYVFARSGTAWSQVAYLKASNTGAGDQFGNFVAASGDTIVVGAPNEDSATNGVNSAPNDLAADAGAAYVFTGFAPPATFSAWAAANIPAGQSAAFDADWNRDGILNGVAYVFGSTRFSPTGKGRVPAPSAIPADVNLFLDRSTTLTAGSWTPVASWVNGAAPVFVSGVSLVGGEVRDTFTGPRASYRYRVVLR